MNHFLGSINKIVAGIAIAALPLIAHIVIAHQNRPIFSVGLVIIFTVAIVWLVWRQVASLAKRIVIVLIVFGGSGFALLQPKVSVPIISALPHTVAYIALIGVFASSLRRGRIPIVTRFALKIHGPASDRIKRYTRHVTLAWCSFFMAQLIISAILFSFFPIAVWSFFINILNLPFLVLMFIGERLYRAIYMSEAPRENVADVMRIFTMVKNDISQRFVGAQ